MKSKLFKFFNKFYSWLKLPSCFMVFLFLVFIVFLILDWFTAVSLRAGKIDHYILFSMAETTRFYYAQVALCNPFVFLNPNAKPVYSLISSAFVFLLPWGLFSLKLLNSLLSVGILMVLYKLMKKMGFGNFAIAIATILTVTFPLFFLLSIAALSEILFCFFLVTAFYFFFSKKYFICALLISLLPLIRQEGVLYICLMLFFLLKERKIYVALILGLPLLVWVLLNSFLLNHSVLYPFFVSMDMPGPTLKSSVMSLREFKNFILPIFYHPLFFLFPIGFIWMVLKKRCLPVIVALTFHCFFITIGLFIQFLIIGQVSCDFRYIVPLIPLMALVASGVFESFILRKKLKIFIIIMIVCSLISILINRITMLQKIPRVNSESLTVKQEERIDGLVIWLKDYIKETGICKVYFSGDLISNKIIRRLRAYLAQSITMYPVREFREVYDPITFKIIEKEFSNSELTGLILLIDPDKEKSFILHERIKSIKTFSDISIYLYRKY